MRKSDNAGESEQSSEDIIPLLLQDLWPITDNLKTMNSPYITIKSNVKLSGTMAVDNELLSLSSNTIQCEEIRMEILNVYGWCY